MYLEYFGLTEKPFSIAPDPHYLYMSARHKEAMAHLTYGLSQGGCFIVLTGEVGTGKTTLCRNLLEDLPESVEVALILNANINEEELLQTVCDELKIAYPEDCSQKQLLDHIYIHLLAKFADNRQTVLIIDEAQLLSRDVLEQIRLLTNLETTKSKLLQIILIGQPELNDLLSRNDLRQLAQRVTARYHLGALPQAEIEEYVNFRLGVAGCRKPLFSRQALGQLYRSTEGIPRRINVLADHALLSAYSKNQVIVDAKSVKAASSEVFVQSSTSNKRTIAPRNWWLLAGLSLISLNIALWWWFAGSNDAPSTLVERAPTEVQSNTVSSQPDQIDVQSTPSDADAANAPESAPLAAVSDTGETAVGDSLTTILTSDDIDPGSVIISDEPLDDEPLLVNPVPQVVLPGYDADSEFGKVLDASADVSGRIAAFRSLAEAWDVSLPSKILRPVCVELRERKTPCLEISTWGRLTRINRPTIMAINQRDQLHRVIVFKLEGDVAQVLVGENVHSVSVEELQARWTRSAIALWRPTEVLGKFLQQGDIDADLLRVRQRLNRVLSTLAMPVALQVESDEFDLDLAQKVFALQTRFSILADSKIGDETYLLMNEVLQPESTPVLTQRVQP